MATLAIRTNAIKMQNTKSVLPLYHKVEYEALIVGLEILLELGATRVEIMGDSELVIKQVTKEYKCIREKSYYVLCDGKLFIEKVRSG